MIAESMLDELHRIQSKVYCMFTQFDKVCDEQIEEKENLPCIQCDELQDISNNCVVTEQDDVRKLGIYPEIKNNDSKEVLSTTDELMDRKQQSKYSSAYKPESLMAEALGLINYLNMFTLSGNRKYLESAFSLINTVHITLGYNEPVIETTVKRNHRYTVNNIKREIDSKRGKQSDQIDEIVNELVESDSRVLTNEKYATTTINDENATTTINDDCSSSDTESDQTSCSQCSSKCYSTESTCDSIVHSLKSLNENPISNGLRTTSVFQVDCNPGYSKGRYYKHLQNGQHIHQICKWMFSLLQTSKVTGNEIYGQYAIRLGKHVYHKFCYDKSLKTRSGCALNGNSSKSLKLLAMYWKMNNDLTLPIVKCEGNLDTFLCLAVFALLQDWNIEVCKENKKELNLNEDLTEEIQELNDMVQIRICHLNPLSCGFDIGEALWICSICTSSASLSRFNNDWQRKLKLLSLAFVGSYIDTALTRPITLRCGYKELCITVGLRSLQKTLQELNVSNISANQLTVSLSELIRSILSCWKNYLFIHDCTITPLLYCLAINPGHYINN